MCLPVFAVREGPLQILLVGLDHLLERVTRKNFGITSR